MMTNNSLSLLTDDHQAFFHCLGASRVGMQKIQLGIKQSCLPLLLPTPYSLFGGLG